MRTLLTLLIMPCIAGSWIVEAPIRAQIGSGSACDLGSEWREFPSDEWELVSSTESGFRADQTLLRWEPVTDRSSSPVALARSVLPVDLTDCPFVASVRPPVAGAGSRLARVSLGADASDFPHAQVRVVGGTIQYTVQWTAEIQGLASEPYDPSAHRYWRLRWDEPDIVLEVGGCGPWLEALRVDTRGEEPPETCESSDIIWSASEVANFWTLEEPADPAVTLSYVGGQVIIGEGGESGEFTVLRPSAARLYDPRTCGIAYEMLPAVARTEDLSSSFAVINIADPNALVFFTEAVFSRSDEFGDRWRGGINGSQNFEDGPLTSYFRVFWDAATSEMVAQISFDDFATVQQEVRRSETSFGPFDFSEPWEIVLGASVGYFAGTPAWDTDGFISSIRFFDLAVPDVYEDWCDFPGDRWGRFASSPEPPDATITATCDSGLTIEWEDPVETVQVLRHQSADDDGPTLGDRILALPISPITTAEPPQVLAGLFSQEFAEPYIEAYFTLTEDNINLDLFVFDDGSTLVSEDVALDSPASVQVGWSYSGGRIRLWYHIGDGWVEGASAAVSSGAVDAVKFDLQTNVGSTPPLGGTTITQPVTFGVIYYVGDPEPGEPTLPPVNRIYLEQGIQSSPTFDEGERSGWFGPINTPQWRAEARIRTELGPPEEQCWQTQVTLRTDIGGG